MSHLGISFDGWFGRFRMDGRSDGWFGQAHHERGFHPHPGLPPSRGKGLL